MRKVTEKTEKKPLVIDFSKIEAKDITGNPIVYQADEVIANSIYTNTPSIKMLDFAMRIYKDKKLELNEEEQAFLQIILSQDETPVKAIVKKRLLEMLEG